MTPKSREDFETVTGGLFDDFDGSIVGAKFGLPTGSYASTSGGTAPGLTLTFNNPDAEKPFDQFFSIGNGWEIVDDGKAVRNINKPESHVFTKSSKAGKITDAALKLVGAGDVEKGQEIFIKRDFYMTEAAFYLGWNAHWNIEESKMTIDKQEKIIKTLTPTIWIGFAGGTTAQAAPAGGAKAAGPIGDAAKMDEELIKLSAGKTERELKQLAINKDNTAKFTSEYKRDIVNGTILKRLETDGKLFKDEKGLYMAV